MLAAVAAVTLLAGASARAQETTAPAPAKGDEQEEQGADRRHIQVLQSPYEISSFYRSSQGASPAGFGYEPDGGGPYPIAGFYRAQRGMGRGGYSAFWTSGYGMSRGRGRGLLGAPRTRALGLNGDLCLFAPFLAPVGPLSGVFFESR